MLLEKPALAVGSPPCTDFSILTKHWCHPRMSPEEVRQRMVEARLRVSFFAGIYRRQVESGRHFLHEHRPPASIWGGEPAILQLLSHPMVNGAVCHQCEYGLTSRNADGDELPALKPTQWMISAPLLLQRLRRRCSGGHSHTRQLGGQSCGCC